MKRIAILFLAALVSTSVLAGCGKKEAKIEEVENVEVLKHLGPYDKFDPNADPTAKVIEEITGQKIEYSVLPAENAMEKLNLELAGEAKYNSVKLYRNQFDILVAKNVVLDLKPILESHGKNILEAIGKESWDSVTVDGKIYGIPEKNSADIINASFFVRKDILDKNGLKMPETTDEFYNVCKELKAKGVEIPASLDQKLSNSIMGAFGVAQEWNERDGKLVYRGLDDNYAKYLDFLKKMNDEGLLGQDWATIKFGDSQERFINGDSVFIVSGWTKGKAIYDALKTNGGVEKPEEAVAYIPSLKGPDGYVGVPRDKGVNLVTVIPRYMEKEAIQTIKWMDKKLEAENFKKFVIGEEGYHFTVKEGAYFPNLENNDAGKPKFDEKNNSSWFLTGTREKEYAEYWQARVRKTPENYDAFSRINKEVDKFGVYNPLGFAPNIESVSVNKQALDTAVGDFATQYISGTTQDLAALKKQLEAAKIEEITKDVNDYYNTIKK
jgi:putative aldouronate transport system substrate-binding protein